jgi:hypothetical protein
MKVYTYTQARQNLASLLDQAAKEGEVWIKRQDGQVFAVRPAPRKGSPLDVQGIDLGLTADEIVQFVQEGRRTAGWLDTAGEEEQAPAHLHVIREDREAVYRETAQDEGREEEVPEGGRPSE